MEEALTVISTTEIINQWDSTKDFVFDGCPKEIDDYLLAIDTIQRSINVGGPTTAQPAQCLLSRAMVRLGAEFRNILVLNNKNPSDHNQNHHQFSPGSSDAYSSSMTDSASNYEYSQEDENGIMSNEALTDLRRIAERMKAAGCLNDCIRVYIDVRKNYVNSTLRRLNVQSLTIQSVGRLEWELLEKFIRDWIRAVKICIRVLFMGEKRISEIIFQGLDHYYDDDGRVEYSVTSYVEIVKDPAKIMFDFVLAICSVRPSYEKLFRLLDIYETLSDLLPQVNNLFRGEELRPILVQASELLPKLTFTIRKALLKFEKAVVREKSKVVQGVVRIHPLTKYVMNYISKICDYDQTLTALIELKPSKDMCRHMTIGVIEFEGQTPLSVHLNWIIMNLDLNLETKSKLYEDASLGCLFTMNNFHFIVQKIERHPQLRELTAYYYLNEISTKLDRAKAEYLKLTSDKFSYCLRNEGLEMSGIFASRILKRRLRQRIKHFNFVFSEFLKSGSQLVELDLKVLMKLQIRIMEMLVPVYASFLERFGRYIECGKQSRRYVKYSVEDVQSKILLLTSRHNVADSSVN